MDRFFTVLCASENDVKLIKEQIERWSVASVQHGGLAQGGNFEHTTAAPTHKSLIEELMSNIPDVPSLDSANIDSREHWLQGLELGFARLSRVLDYRHELLLERIDKLPTAVAKELVKPTSNVFSSFENISRSTFEPSTSYAAPTGNLDALSEMRTMKLLRASSPLCFSPRYDMVQNPFKCVVSRAASATA